MERSVLLQSCCKAPVPGVFLQQAVPGQCRGAGRQSCGSAEQGSSASTALHAWAAGEGQEPLAWSGHHLGLAGDRRLSPHLTAQGTFAAEGADLEQGVNVAVLMSEVLSVFTRAENLLSKSKCCAKTESQTVLRIYEPIQQNNVEVTLMGTRKWSLQVWGSQAVQYGLFHVHGSKRGKKDF